MRKARYICLEGTEGVGKTTQTQLLVDFLRSKGFTVLQTREPGSVHAPLTNLLRGVMLDNQYEDQMTRPAREFISQAIRSIHLEKVIAPALREYDFIIQDRGILSGYAYGEACGNRLDDLRSFALQNLDSVSERSELFPLVAEHMYDTVLYLRGDTFKNLQKAKSSKQEFATGDAMESKEDSFYERVSNNFETMSSRFKTVRIDVDGKSIDQVQAEILTALGLEK